MCATCRDKCKDAPSYEDQISGDVGGPGDLWGEERIAFEDAKRRHPSAFHQTVQQEDGSTRCLRCNGDWYGCDCGSVRIDDLWLIVVVGLGMIVGILFLLPLLVRFAVGVTG